MSEASETPMEALVTEYLRLRTAVQEKEAELTDVIGALKAEMEAISNQLLDVCNKTDADSIRTKYGTVSRRVTTRYWTTDWEAMHNFIKEHDALHLLEQRIHNGNMRQFLHDNHEYYPVGLQADSKFTIQVRKPTAR
jgi:hypothetical protein